RDQQFTLGLLDAYEQPCLTDVHEGVVDDEQLLVRSSVRAFDVPHEGQAQHPGAQIVNLVDWARCDHCAAGSTSRPSASESHHARPPCSPVPWLLPDIALHPFWRGPS